MLQMLKEKIETNGKGDLPQMDTVINSTYIQKTNDYEKFKISPVNREVNMKKVDNLKKAILDRDLTHLTPILVDKDLTILDGQHRYWACFELNYPIYYVIANDGIQSDMQMLNQNTTVWTLIDHIKYHAKMGNENYQRLLDDAEISGISASKLISIFYKTSGNAKSEGGGHNIKGGLMIYDGIKRKIFHDLLSQLEWFSSFPFYRNRSFIAGLFQLTKSYGYNKDMMEKQVKTYGLDHLKPHSGQRAYYENLIQIYNYNLNKQNRIVLTYEP